MDLKLITIFANGIIFVLFLLYGYYFLIITNPNRLKHVLGYIMLFWSLLLFKDILFMCDLIQTNERIYKLLLTVDNWAVATCNIYAIELLRPRWITWRYISLNFFGYFLFTLLYGITGNDNIYFINVIYTVIYCLFTLVYIAVNTVSYTKKVKNMYSNLTRINVRWLWVAIGIMLMNLFFWIYIYSVTTYEMDVWYYFTICLVWSIIAYNTNRQIIWTEDTTVQAKVDTGMEAHNNESFHFANKLDKLINEKYFCHSPVLTLNDLANELNTNRTTLSSYINKVIGMNFYDFINNLRIEYAEQLLLDPNTKMTQEEIAEKSGFNSLSTFRRAFQKKHGISPLQFCRNKAL